MSIIIGLVAGGLIAFAGGRFLSDHITLTLLSDYDAVGALLASGQANPLGWLIWAVLLALAVSAVKSFVDEMSYRRPRSYKLGLGVGFVLTAVVVMVQLLTQNTAYLAGATLAIILSGLFGIVWSVVVAGGIAGALFYFGFATLLELGVAAGIGILGGVIVVIIVVVILIAGTFLTVGVEDGEFSLIAAGFAFGVVVLFPIVTGYLFPAQQPNNEVTPTPNIAVAQQPTVASTLTTPLFIIEPTSTLTRINGLTETATIQAADKPTLDPMHLRATNDIIRATQDKALTQTAEAIFQIPLPTPTPTLALFPTLNPTPSGAGVQQTNNTSPQSVGGFWGWVSALGGSAFFQSTIAFALALFGINWGLRRFRDEFSKTETNGSLF